jgi:hypothetical protein
LIRQLGMLAHTVQVRFNRLDALLGMRPGPSSPDLLETLVDYFIMENVPISHIDAHFFRAAPYGLDPTVANHMLNPHQLNAAIPRRALALHESVTTTDSSSHSVSLMADGVRKAGCLWPGICLATVENLYFWRLVNDTHQKNTTIRDMLAETIRDLKIRGFTVCLIITDNASNELWP